jgi:hypothetical protein
MIKFLYKLITNFLGLFGCLCLVSIKHIAYKTTITVTGSWVVTVIVLAVGISIVQQLRERS